VGAARVARSPRTATPFPSLSISGATQSAPFLSRDVALEVLPRGHFQSTRALARLIAARRPTPPSRRSPSPISSMRSPRRRAGRRDRAILAYHGFSASEPQLLSRIGYRLNAAPHPNRRGDGRGLGGAAPRSHRSICRSTTARADDLQPRRAGAVP